MEKYNQVILYTGIGEAKKKVELYNFQTIDHYVDGGRYYIRVNCGGKFHYYPLQETTIASINIYNVMHK